MPEGLTAKQQMLWRMAHLQQTTPSSGQLSPMTFTVDPNLNKLTTVDVLGMHVPKWLLWTLGVGVVVGGVLVVRHMRAA